MIVAAIATETTFLHYGLREGLNHISSETINKFRTSWSSLSELAKKLEG